MGIQDINTLKRVERHRVADIIRRDKTYSQNELLRREATEELVKRPGENDLQFRVRLAQWEKEGRCFGDIITPEAEQRGEFEDQYVTHADSNTTAIASGSSWSDSLSLLLHGVGSVLARYSFVLHPSPRAAVFLTWLIVPGIVMAWRRDQRLVAIQALLLLLAAIGIDAIGVSRGLKAEYFIFTDPLIILATAILLDSLSFLRFPKWAYPVAIMLLALHIVGSQAEPLKSAFSHRGPETICQWNQHYLALLPLPWCKLPPVRP